VQIPKEAANLQMDLQVIVETFVIVVIGGMGSIFGAFLAAIIVGQVHAFGVVAFPSLTLVLIFLVMAVVLVFRPMGLLGRRERPQRLAPEAMERPYAPAARSVVILWAVALAALLAVPLFATDYALVILTEVCVLAVFAASLHFLMAVGGMVSFGHAAYFGAGAYLAALAAIKLGLPMALAILVAGFGSAAIGALFGWFCTRLFGVYLAMLTLAFAQILWSVSIQWVGVTGGDNGIVGIQAASWVASRASFYYFALFIAVAALVCLRQIVFSPFGYTLRAGRDSPLRADATGVNVRRHQWMAFVVSGAFAGLAGAVIAFQRGQVFPNDLSIATTVDGLVMVLLGGIQTLTGPVVGAVSYHLVNTELVRNFENYWRLILGTAIVLLVLAFPQGIVGAVQNFATRRRAAEVRA
jgi:branched-chain amino acid transport system permease protein